MSDSDNKLDVSSHPGAILRAAREELPLSVEQVASSLHLRSTVVLSMERDRYEEFDSDVFLKGYFRSYCRLVGLHEERMVALLETQLAKLAEVRAREKETALKIERLRKRKKSVQQAILVAVLLLFGAVSVYMLLKPESKQVEPIKALQDPALSNRSELQSSVSTSETIPLALSQPLSSDATQPNAIEPLSSLQADAEFEQKPETGSSTTTENNAIADIQEHDAMTFEPQTGIDELQTELQSARNDSMLDNEDGLSATESVASNASADGAEPALIVTFSGDCWLKVVNGDERTPIARLQRAGDRVVYNGPRPYRVVLGDATVAKVAYLGQPYNLLSVTRRNGRAEFVLD